jgi:hypothetical protein
MSLTDEEWNYAKHLCATEHFSMASLFGYWLGAHKEKRLFVFDHATWEMVRGYAESQAEVFIRRVSKDEVLNTLYEEGIREHPYSR